MSVATLSVAQEATLVLELRREFDLEVVCVSRRDLQDCEQVQSLFVFEFRHSNLIIRRCTIGPGNSSCSRVRS